MKIFNSQWYCFDYAKRDYTRLMNCTGVVTEHGPGVPHSCLASTTGQGVLFAQIRKLKKRVSFAGNRPVSGETGRLPADFA